MNELQIMNLEHTDISLWDFDQLRQELQKGLDSYAGLVYTDETIKDAKNDRSTLNKVKKVIEDARKQYKAKCLAPYEVVEPKVKELVDMVEAQRGIIDATVKEYEARQKQEKEQEIRQYFSRKAAILGDMADVLYPKLLDPKWLNVTTGRAKYEEGIQTAINKAREEIESIKKLDSPFTDALMDVYKETLSIEKVQIKNEELLAAASAAGLTRKSEEAGDTPKAAEVKIQMPADQDNGVNLRIFAGTNQMNQICDFMKAIGVRYEFI